jgi:(2Fe-2S) ferredoxin
MEKMKKGDLAKFRSSYKPNCKGEVVISMGTCGIAAGGDAIYKLFETEMKEKGLDNIKLKKTGCLGMCFCEPNMVVKIDGMPDILYGNVDERIALLIMNEHLTKKRIVNFNTIFMPTNDIGKKIYKD